MKKTFVSVILLLLLSSGCTHTFIQYSNEDNNEFFTRVERLCKDRDDLIIQTVDKIEYNARELKISEDTTDFIEISTNKFISISTEQISTISFSQPVRGAFEGFLYGTLIGGGVGFSPSIFSRGIGHPGLSIDILLYSTLAGAVIGTTYGIISESKSVIKIN